MARTGASTMSPPSDYSLRRLEIERCRQEIAAVEAAILGGHPDVEGLCRALADWSEELRMLQNEERRQALNLATS